MRSIQIGLLAMALASLAPAPGSRVFAEEDPPAADSGGWDIAIEQIRKSKIYGGLWLPVQKGLIPLGPDPASGLFEFAVEGSGSIPKRDAETERLIIEDDFAVVLVLVPGGSFWMGAQKDDPQRPNYQRRVHRNQSPVCQVTLLPFFMSKFEATQAQWAALSGGTPSKHQGSPRLPVDTVSWKDCGTTLRAAGLALPSESRWEFACRAGTSTRYGASSDESHLALTAWYAGNSETEGERRTHPVGEKAPNAFGLHDMLGNVREWCSDAWHDSLEGLPLDGRARTISRPRNRPCRGGGFRSRASHIGSAERSSTSPKRGSNDLGVRPARPIRAAETPPSEPSDLSWAKVAPAQLSAAKTFEVPVAFENDLGMRFVLVPAGTFTMGQADGGIDEHDAPHKVTLSVPFYVQVTEVTNGQYRRFRPDHRSNLGRGFDLNAKDQPVVNVAYADAVEFGKWLSARDTPRTYRLPTEARWEFACRAGTTGNYSFGNDWKELVAYGNFLDRDLEPDDPVAKAGLDDGHDLTAPVASYKPNPWGIYDMHGNVSEWCSDYYAPFGKTAVVDPTGPAAPWSGGDPLFGSGGRVSRGGSCASPPFSLRSATRWGQDGAADFWTGFRLVSPLVEDW